MSHDSSLSRSFPGYISVLLIVIYSPGAVMVTKDNHRKIKSSLSTIAMQVEVVIAFAWIWQ